ncbi:hypothetical protein [Microvirga sp. M2]|uniref:hypothetical protein n=1 Tax=Microvirga sp. M2 TaxID=3073270 RepID=UPI0039C3DEBF
MRTEFSVPPAPGAITRLPWLRANARRREVRAPPDLDRALVTPASVFASPADVVRHPRLTLDGKREILWRWAWDEYLLDLALADGMPEGEPPRLPEVKAALRLLNIEWSPDPAAPAMPIPQVEQHELCLAA